MSVEVAAALIAAGAAFVGVVIAKEQKTTEFRQDWINNQRIDLAVMMACALSASRNAECGGEALRKFDEAHGRVRLRENHEKQEWLVVLEALDRLRDQAFVMTAPFDIAPTNSLIVEHSQKLLKAEWSRVRAGENWFKFTRWMIPAAVALTGLCLAHGKGFIVLG